VFHFGISLGSIRSVGDHPSRSYIAAVPTSIPETVAAAWRRHLRILRQEIPKWNTISISATTWRKPGRLPSRRSRSRSPTGCSTCGPPSRPGSPSTTSRRDCRSSSWRARRCSRVAKFRVRAPRSGPGSCRGLRRAGPEAWMLRFHTQTAGVQLTAQQPEVNMSGRGAGARGGAGRHPVAAHQLLRRAIALPTEKRRRRLALRTQQILGL